MLSNFRNPLYSAICWESEFLSFGGVGWDDGETTYPKEWPIHHSRGAIQWDPRLLGAKTIHGRCNMWYQIWSSFSVIHQVSQKKWPESWKDKLWSLFHVVACLKADNVLVIGECGVFMRLWHTWPFCRDPNLICPLNPRGPSVKRALQKDSGKLRFTFV